MKGMRNITAHGYFKIDPNHAFVRKKFKQAYNAQVCVGEKIYIRI
jgi:uncharacterized protein with HEPN domain